MRNGEGRSKYWRASAIGFAAQEENADYSGVIIAKGEPKLLAAINKALADIKADGTYKKIADKYFGQDVSK